MWHWAQAAGHAALVRSHQEPGQLLPAGYSLDQRQHVVGVRRQDCFILANRIVEATRVKESGAKIDANFIVTGLQTNVLLEVVRWLPANAPCASA